MLLISILLKNIIMENILVLGANGKTGTHIVDILNEIDRYHVRVMLRKEEQKANFNEDKVECVIGDLEENFEDVFKNIDKVIFAAGSGGSTGDEKTRAVDRDGAKKAIDYAVHHNLNKFVMLSSIGTDNPEEAGDLQEYLKAKKAADDYLESKAINYSIVRPGALTNEEPTHQIKVIDGLEKGSINRKDVAYVLVKTLEDKICKNGKITFISGDKDIDQVLETY
jgi:uncharacterized protein YbjT (DUF2867 family)